VRRFLKRPRRHVLSEAATLREIDERHHVAQQVFFRREARGWSHRDLAALTGLSTRQIALIEAGYANPTLRGLVSLAHAFSCSVAELVSPRDAAAPTDPPRALIG
jgi:transcriptional regulator with XRE-family HTH domain